MRPVRAARHASIVAVHDAEFDRKPDVEDAYPLGADAVEQPTRLVLADGKIDLDREIASELEEVLLVYHAVTAEAGSNAIARAAVFTLFRNMPCLRLFYQVLTPPSLGSTPTGA